MFKFLRQSVPIDAQDSRSAPESVSQRISGPSSSFKPQADIKHELIRVVLKDTLRRHGIPFDWITCEVMTISHGANHEELHIQLMLMQWRELFMRYAQALEYQLLRGLDRFEPHVDHSKYIISWRFSPECGCPFSVLPPPMVWLHDEAPEAPVKEAPSILDRRHSKRPEKATAPAAVPKRDDGDYERTELSPFR